MMMKERFFINILKDQEPDFVALKLTIIKKKVTVIKKLTLSKVIYTKNL